MGVRKDFIKIRKNAVYLADFSRRDAIGTLIISHSKDFQTIG
jgi:hypothetical protein